MTNIPSEDVDVPPSIPAATVIVLRDPPNGDGAPELLVLRRASAMTFAGGAIAFPGGRVDPADGALAAILDHGLEMDDAAARVAAIRETLEETGIAIGFHDLLDAQVVADLRIGLHAGEAFPDLVDRHRLSLDLDALIPFARWCPPNVERVPRRFDTRFYVARHTAGGQDGAVDGTENDRLSWGTAWAFLDACAAGGDRALFPTLRNLERLAHGGTIDGIAALARAYPVDLIQPWVEERDGILHLCIRDDLGYPVTAVPVDRAFRS